MKNLFFIFFFIVVIISNSFAQTINKGFLDGRVYFKVKDSYSIPYSKKDGVINLKSLAFLRDIIHKYDVTSVRNSFYTAKSPVLERTFLIKFNKISAVDDLIKDLELLEYIERIDKAPLFKILFTPNDYGTTAGNNWHLTKINAQGAWDITHGLASVKIAVIDNAMYSDHPDLINKVVAKIDLANDDAITTPPVVSTNYLDASWTWSHGTHTSGLVGAETNNGTGVPSIGFDVSLIAIKAADDSTQMMTAGLEGIVWAADTGARVINMSWGGPQYVPVMQDIVNYAYNKGCVLVASAGNNGDGSQDSTTANVIMYPAACNHVISVGATNGNDVATTFSQYGAWIDVMAPGGYQTSGTFLEILLNSAVYSTVYTSAAGGYGKMAGTSMSSPITAGLCGLMLSINPNLTPDELTTILKNTCFNIESLQDVAHQGNVGAGRINAQAAVSGAQNAITPVTANFSASSTSIPEGGTVTFTDLSVGNPISWQWTFSGGVPSSFDGQNPPAVTYSTDGSYTVSLLISDGINNDTEVKSTYIIVNAPPPPSAWIEQAAGFTVQNRGAYQITIVSSDVVWATAVDGTNGQPVKEFTKTIDGGNTWIPGTITGPPAAWNVSNLSAVSADKAWIAMYTTVAGGRIYITTDGGTTWTQQTSALYNTTASFPNVVHFFDDNNGFTMGDPANNEFEIYTTTDGGVTWNLVPVANIPNAVSGEMGWTNVYDVVGNTIWFGTNKGRIFKSVDKGYNWTMTDAGMGDCQRVTFSDQDNGMVQKITYTSGVVTAFVTKVTHDGGETWTLVNPTGPIWKGDISAVPGLPGRYISVGSDGAAAGSAHYGSSYSLDYGANWTMIDTGIQYINTRFYDEFTGWASGFVVSPTQGGMYKWSPGIVSVNSIIVNNKNMIVFPNPNNGLFNIQLETANHSLIQIFDMTGKIVYNNNVESKNGSISVNISSCGKGIYFVKIQSDKITTGKIIIE